MGAAGFFLVSTIPRYFQEMQGHTVGGGSEMGTIAGGCIMGRLGSQALQATKGGIMMNQGLESARQQAYTAQGANTVIEAQDQATAGLPAAQVYAQTVHGQAELDGAGTMPLSRDTKSAERALNTEPASRETRTWRIRSPPETGRTAGAGWSIPTSSPGTTASWSRV